MSLSKSCFVFLSICSFASILNAQITSQFREVVVDAMARDAIFDEDDVIVSDQASSMFDGLFNESLEVNASTITGCTFSDSSQTSMIDMVGNTFSAFSEIETRSEEDGSSSSSATSLVEIQFAMPIGGAVDLFQLELTAQRAQINKNSQDDEFERSDDGSVSVVIVDNGMEFFNETLVIERDELGDDLSAGQTIQLPAGNYTMIIQAQIVGDDSFNSVQGQPRGSNLSFCVEGTISPDQLGDINCDGNVNLLDVQPFVAVLSSGGYSVKADINMDGAVNLLDVDGFVDLLGGN